MKWTDALGEQFSFGELSKISNPKLIETRCEELLRIVVTEIGLRVETELAKQVLPALQRAGFDLRLDRQGDDALWLNAVDPQDPQYLVVDVVVSGHFGKLGNDNQG